MCKPYDGQKCRLFARSEIERGILDRRDERHDEFLEAKGMTEKELQDERVRQDWYSGIGIHLPNISRDERWGLSDEVDHVFSLSGNGAEEFIHQALRDRDHELASCIAVQVSNVRIPMGLYRLGLRSTFSDIKVLDGYVRQEYSKQDLKDGAEGFQDLSLKARGDEMATIFAKWFSERMYSVDLHDKALAYERGSHVVDLKSHNRNFLRRALRDQDASSCDFFCQTVLFEMPVQVREDFFKFSMDAEIALRLFSSPALTQRLFDGGDVRSVLKRAFVERVEDWRFADEEGGQLGDAEKAFLSTLDEDDLINSPSFIKSILDSGLFAGEEEFLTFFDFDSSFFRRVEGGLFHDDISVIDRIRLARMLPSLNWMGISAVLEEAGIAVADRIPEEQLEYLQRVVSFGQNVDREIFLARSEFSISPFQAEVLKSDFPAAFLRDGRGRLDYDLIADHLRFDVSHYGRVEDLSMEDEEGEVYESDNQIWFARMRELFGAEIAIKYGNRLGLSVHDAYFAVDSIIALQALSGETPDRFGQNILLQVAKDGQVYRSGFAQHELNAISQLLEGRDLNQLLEQAKAFSAIDVLQTWVRGVERDPSRPFSSWKGLRNYASMVRLLDRSDFLTELQHETDPRKRVYFERLILHENVDTGKVLMFREDPAAFLDIDDGHTDAEVNKVKKPSNYLSLPFLGLDGKDMRDALIGGSLDKIQTLPPMEREYRLYDSPENDPSIPRVLHRFIQEAVGKRRFGIPGKAKHPGKVFSRIQRWCKREGVRWRNVWQDPVGLMQLSHEQREALEEIVFDDDIGLLRPNGEVYRMKLGAKSDPEMVIAGNDTASCMPFGSGKNNVYMFNPNCAQIVLERKNAEGEWRTVAQSVVNIDMETEMDVPAILGAYKRQGHINDVVAATDFGNREVIACDNIEVAKNAQGKASTFISEAYRRFMTDYLDVHAEGLEVDATRVVVGKGYTPAALGFDQIDNHFIPQAPMGYSDNSGEKCFVLETGLAECEAPVRKGVSRMTTRDAIAVTSIEGKAYADNASLLENLHGMQNNIIGMEIANAYFERPNLSFMYRNTRGIPQGYILAYEGRTKDGVRQVYISDLAARPGSRLAGGKLIREFFESYLGAYQEGDEDMLPIFTNARGKTSYQILTRQFERMATKVGLVAEMDVVGQRNEGGDEFFDVRVYLGRDAEEVERQRAKF